MFLKDKKILFFSAQAFGYQNEIRAQMERLERMWIISTNARPILLS